MGMIQQLVEFFTGDQKVYWAFAIVGTTIFVIQTVLTMFMGFGGDSDVDGDGTVGFGEHADTGLAEFHIFSTRSIVAFIAFFGWGGILWGKEGMSALFAAFASGLMMMFVSALIVYFLMRLQQSGNINPAEMVGLTGVVYLTVPAGKENTGLVNVTIRERNRQIRAIAAEEIPTGTAVRVKEMIGSQRYLVEKA
jgi:hypothetical protein